MKTNAFPKLLLISVAGLAVAAISTAALAQDPKTDPKKETRIERGRYLAEEVARCQECHTPTLPDGTFDRANWMKGATLVGIPAKPIEDWHQKAPDITSTSKLWTNWKYEGIAKFLQTGKTPRDKRSGPPMPAYTLKPEDAEAITAYLKSLP
ncbi:MAG TPA: cytochrome c [Vicinamibacteria bacterium]|nr:cytochrome c [Vicinamibacteria bacterium]